MASEPSHAPDTQCAGSGRGHPDSPLDGHPNPMEGVPFFDAATGSLGQGLSVAAGLGLAAIADQTERKVYCIIGDGESQEQFLELLQNWKPSS